MQCENNCLFFMNCYLLSSWFSLFFEELKTWIELKKFVHKLKNNLSLFSSFRESIIRIISILSTCYTRETDRSGLLSIYYFSSLFNFFSFQFLSLFLIFHHFPFLWFLSSYLKCPFPFTFYFSVTLCFNFWILFIISLSTRRQFECQFRSFFSIIFFSLLFFICLFSHPSLFTSLIPSLGQSLSPPAHKCI